MPQQKDRGVSVMGVHHKYQISKCWDVFFCWGKMMIISIIMENWGVALILGAEVVFPVGCPVGCPVLDHSNIPAGGFQCLKRQLARKICLCSSTGSSPVPWTSQISAKSLAKASVNVVRTGFSLASHCSNRFLVGG